MNTEQLNEKYNTFAAIGDGWADIVDKALSICLVLDPDMRIAQIKQKFGGLRIYLDINQNFEAIQDTIQLAEWLAYRTCEVCGASGTNYHHGIVCTRCDEHAPEEEKFDYEFE